MDSIWYEVLVIILSIFLGIFLVLSIVLVSLLIKISKTIKRITDQAEMVADRAEHIASFFEKSATPVALVKLLSNIGDVFQKKDRGKK